MARIRDTKTGGPPRLPLVRAAGLFGLTFASLQLLGLSKRIHEKVASSLQQRRCRYYVCFPGGNLAKPET